MAALAGFVQNQWAAPVNDADYYQDSNKVAAMRYQSIWPVVEALDTPEWLRIEMDYHTYRWTQLMRGMYTFGHNQLAYRRLRALGTVTAAQETKRRNERLRLKKAYNELVASTVMLYQRVCRFIGNDHRGKPSRMNHNFDPDFLLWSVKWFDLMKTYKWKDAIMEGRTTYRREFKVGPAYVPPEGGILARPQQVVDYSRFCQREEQGLRGKNMCDMELMCWVLVWMGSLCSHSCLMHEINGLGDGRIYHGFPQVSVPTFTLRPKFVWECNFKSVLLHNHKEMKQRNLKYGFSGSDSIYS